MYKPPGGLYLEGRFNGGFFALPVWGAYIWRGLYMEGLIFGILRYIKKIMYMFVSFFKNVSHYCFMRWRQKFRKCIVFFLALRPPNEFSVQYVFH